MFIIELTYIRPLAEVEALIPAHVDWLDEQYAEGAFVLSGRREPRTGGMIIAADLDRTDLERRMERDPFQLNGIAEYRIEEFLPSKASPELSHLVRKA